MEQHTIEIFMPSGTTDVAQMSEFTGAIPSLAHLWLWIPTSYEADQPSRTTLLAVDSLTSTGLFKDMAERASADFVLYLQNILTSIVFFES